MGLFNLQYAAAYALRAAEPHFPFFASRHLLLTAPSVRSGSIAAISLGVLPSFWARMNVLSSYSDQGENFAEGVISATYALRVAVPAFPIFALFHLVFTALSVLPGSIAAISLSVLPSLWAWMKVISSSSDQGLGFSAGVHSAAAAYALRAAVPACPLLASRHLCPTTHSVLPGIIAAISSEFCPPCGPG